MAPVDSGNSSGKLARSRLYPAVQRAQMAPIPELGALNEYRFHFHRFVCCDVLIPGALPGEAYQRGSNVTKNVPVLRVDHITIKTIFAASVASL
jgi:hypothetical protein